MLSLDGQEWRERRVKLSPIFTSGKMKMMFEIVDSISNKFVNVFNGSQDNSQVFDIREWTARYTSDVIGVARYHENNINLCLLSFFFFYQGILRLVLNAIVSLSILT